MLLAKSTRASSRALDSDAINKEWIYTIKRFARVFIDISLFSTALILAYKIRLWENVPNATQDWYWAIQLPTVLLPTVTIRLFFLFVFQIYSKMWRYTELGEILDLSKPILFSSLVLALPRILGFSSINNLFVIPISVIIIDSLLSLIFLSSARLIRKWQIANRAIRKREKEGAKTSKKRTLIIGAGEAGQELARKVLQHPELDIEIVCAIDDDPRKQKMKITNSLEVVGYTKDLHQLISEYNIEQILIAIPSLSQNHIRDIVKLCNSTGLETNIIPGVDQLAGGQVTVEQIRKVSLEDLLGREPVDLSIPEVAGFINDKTVLITGAGGSIGGELTKQLTKNFTPKKIYLLGRGENSIFQLLQEIKEHTKIELIPIICDIRNYKQLYKQLTKASPDVVFHAAAHKHVPLMEDHPIEAFENNVLGTNNISEIVGLIGVKTFVNISTDKAVNPINVLGFTKRLAELVVNSKTKLHPNTKYISVRFGNVIGSRGSVIPIWENQLKKNLEIKVTDKEAYRFFMTMSESAQLVIKAGAIGKSSEIMVLDMGNEVNIYELAKDFIKLSGYTLDDVKIVLTGLRAGEKLKEELIGYYEGANSTKHKKILVIGNKELSEKMLANTISDLISAAENLELESFKEILKKNTLKLNEIESNPLVRT